jgi:hypothetical protein
MRPRLLACFLLILAPALTVAGPGPASDSGPATDLPQHPAELAPLTAQSEFPRFTAAQLAAAGYPDHKHVHGYPGFTPLTDASGQTYGPASLVRGTAVIPREGLAIAEGEIRYRRLRVRFDPETPVWRVLPLVEMLDWAQRELSVLLGHDHGDTLLVIDTLDLDHYRAETGQAFHRLYRDTGEAFIIEPARILMARGLDSHAAFQMTAVRLLSSLAQDHPLPAWLLQGLVFYLAEEGPHFHGQLAMYRDHFPVVMPPAEVEAILAGPPHPDDEIDKRQYRTAGYSAFLMAWDLVEHRGGLSRAVSLLQRIGAGEAPDTVCRELYGHDLAGLATALDPTQRPEPVGAEVAPKVPQRPPAP